jgi:cyclohexyl-isocyanide hydratase
MGGVHSFQGQSTLGDSMNIGMLLFPNNTQLDLTGPQEVFSRIPGARVLLVAQSMDAVASDKGLRILPDVARNDCPGLDILFVPGGSGVNALIQDDVWLDFVAWQGRQARYVTSACTGSLALGAAGLLKGYRATTHWLYLPLLQPFGAVVTDGRVVVDRNRITGGGVTAGIDMALRLAAETSGEACAKAIQLAMEYHPLPPFRSGHPSEADPALVHQLSQSDEEREYFQARMAMVMDAVQRRGI